MCPVNHPALRVPFVFALEQDVISHCETDNSWSYVNVVCDEQSLSRLQLNDEPLMAATIHVIRQNSRHGPLSVDLEAAALVRKRACQQFIAAAAGDYGVAEGREAVSTESGIQGKADHDDKCQLFGH